MKATYFFLKLPLITLFAGLAFTSIIFLAMLESEYRASSLERERGAENRITAIRSGLQNAATNLAVVNRVFVTTGLLSPEQFRQFVTPILQEQTFIKNFTFHRLISDKQRKSFETRLRKLYPHFSIREVREGKLVPVRRKSNYRVIEYVEPMQGNEAALGLDTTSRPAQDAAILRACRTGLPSATKPYTLVHQNLTMRGFVMLAPVYRANFNLDEINTRCEQVIGYTSAVFNTEKLVEKILAERRLENTDEYAVDVYVGDAGHSDELVFSSQHEKKSMAEALQFTKLFDHPPDRSATFDAAGLQWRVVVSANPHSFLERHSVALIILFSGILSSALAAAYVRARLKRVTQAKQLSEEREKNQKEEQAMQATNLRLENERTYLQTLFDQAPSFVAILSGPEHTFEIANNAYYQLVGQRDILGKTVRKALPELDGQGFFELLDHVFQTGQTYVGKNLPLSTSWHPNIPPETRYVDFIYQPMLDGDGSITGIFVQGNDVSALTRTQRELEHLAAHDQLTGLPNASLISTQLEKLISQAASNRSMVVAMVVNIDGFKLADKNYGSIAANGILKIIAQRLQFICEEGGLIGRLGGDKFLLAFETVVKEERAYCSVVQRIKSAVGDKIDIENNDICLACSIGIATYPVDANSADSLIRHADIAMYCAKALGPNSFQFYTPEQNERAQKRLKIETSMRHALERSEFILHYQPQLDLRTGKVVAVEALLRWNHPEFGLLAPNTFIGIAEDNGLIVQIGEWALKTACSQMKLWHDDSRIENLRVAVNLSARQFGHDNLVEMVSTSLKTTGLPPNCLDLELTESLVMADVEHAIRILNELSELGVQLSIDDFGTGYSSLSYLKRFPVDVIKIDRSFIRDIPDNANDAAIADAIISMAHSLGMRVLAEGVETEAQCEFLSSNLCDEIQGYLYSKALPAAEIETYLRKTRCLPAHLLHS